MATTRTGTLLFVLTRHHRSHFSTTCPRFPARRAFLGSCKIMASSDGVTQKITAPYGSWKSPITADIVSGAEKRIGGIAVAGDGRLVWVETRPNEGGRAVLVKESVKPEDEPIDIIPPDFAARTLAQEYGGGAFAVSGDVVIFSNYKDQRLYKQRIGDHLPVPLTPDYDGPVIHFADGVFDYCFNRYITIMEDHRGSDLNPITSIVSIESKDGDIQEPKELVSGNDFYAFPRIDPSGQRMAWIEWSHPNMHWDRAQLWVGYFTENGDLHNLVCVAGGDSNLVESPTEPKWSSKGELFFVTDRKHGFWNIYKWIEHKNDAIAVYTLDAEFTRPLWVFGISSFDFIEIDEKDDNMVCSYRQNGRSYLGILHCIDGSFSALDIPFTDINNIVAGSGCFYIEGASSSHPLSLVKVTLDKNQLTISDISIVWCSSPEITKYASYFSVPEIIKFPTEVPGQNAYAYFYPPSNQAYEASLHEKPPLLVKSHGGPTSETRGTLDLNVQYWTSRGWAFVDVNYGGSTGYGREYRERLLGQWGIVDVNDCCSCARFLVESGKADGERLCITGRSAGGYTTLACLAFRDTFKAGASLYGVADLSLLKAETHKFESHYIDNLVGDDKAIFERSPINFADKFTCPVIFFQGLDDKFCHVKTSGPLPLIFRKQSKNESPITVLKIPTVLDGNKVVPPDQARKMHMTLKVKGLPVALVEYEGEQHGFRKAENIKFTFEQQMVFFARLVGHFEVADQISPIKIDNLD